MRLGLAIGGAVVAVAAGAAVPAEAASLLQSAWWTSNPQLPVPVPADIPGRAGPGQLEVAANATGATSVTAIRFLLGEGESPTSIRMVVVSGTGATAAIVACPTAEAWVPAEGGSLASAPGAACERARSTGVASADGGSWSFPLGPSFVADGAVDLVFTPGTLESTGQAPTFAVVFARPENGALGVTTDPALVNPGTPSAPIAPNASAGFDAAQISDPAAPVDAAPTDPAATEVPAAAPVPQVGSESAPRLPASTPSSGVADRSLAGAARSTDHGRAVGLVLFPLAGLAAIYALNRSVPRLRGVGPLAHDPPDPE